MSESSLLFKMVVFVGLLMVFISLLYPGANAAWTNLETTLSTGPVLPTFPSTPASNQYNTTIPFVADGLSSPDSSQCPLWYQCLNSGTTSGNVTFHKEFTSILGQLPSTSTGVIGLIHVDVDCKNNAGHNTGLWVNITQANGSLVYTKQFSPLCPPVGFLPLGWTDSPISIPLYQIYGATVSIRPWGMIGQDSDSTTLAYFAITLGIQGQPTAACAALDIGCALNAAFQVIIAPFVFLANGIIYVVQLIAALIVFVGQLLFGVMVGLFVSMFYFLNLPGAPAWVQAVVDAFFIGFLIFLALLILDRAVGLFGGLVNKA